MLERRGTIPPFEFGQEEKSLGERGFSATAVATGGGRLLLKIAPRWC